MTTADAIKYAMESIERSSDKIISLGDRIYQYPETGFKEFKTAKIVADHFTTLGLPCFVPEDIPAVKCTLDTGRPGPSVALLAELDAILCPDHPGSDKVTGAAHACGHNVQIASMLGAAKALAQSCVLPALSGKIHFIAVPAEEFIEADFRMELKKKGVISFLGGKQELIRRGFFNDCQLAFMLHVRPGNKAFYLPEGTNGFIVKKISFTGKAAHTGSPWEGINALNAAAIGINALNAVRETFRDEDMVRISPVMTESGKGLNVVPSNAVLESYVRAKSLAAAVSAGESLDRAMLAGAVAVGADLEIRDMPGYLPLNQSDSFTMLCADVMETLADSRSDIGFLGRSGGSTDMGDLSSLMPAVHAYIGGASGSYHSASFCISDKNMAYILGARFMAQTIISLLADGGSAAEKIRAGYTPLFSSMEDYCIALESLFSTKRWSRENHNLFKVEGGV